MTNPTAAHGHLWLAQIRAGLGSSPSKQGRRTLVWLGSGTGRIPVSRQRGEAGHRALERLGRLGIPFWGGGEKKAHQDVRSMVTQHGGGGS
jgi:hypothetical protein